MKIELLGALDYNKLKTMLGEKVDKPDEIINEIKNLENERRGQIVSSAARLSRFPGNVFEVLEMTESNTFEKNLNFIKRVTKMGHDSITDHDYTVFAIQDVSPVIEQTIIAERFCSFTIKSRREVDFSNVGFYTPDFHDEEGNVLQNNEEIKKEYQEYMKSLFESYSEIEALEVPKEDARFVLPYSYYSNILMGVDAHTLRDMIIKFTKTKYSKIQELREFGETLYEIAKEHISYIIDAIDSYEGELKDPVEEFLNSKIELSKRNYEVLDKVKLLNCTANIDDGILVSAIMRRYQFDLEKSKEVYEKLVSENPEFKKELMKKIAFEGDKLELTQVNFEFQVPLSFAVLTHLTRHRTHHIMVPDFVPNIDLTQYKVPPKIAVKCKEKFEKIFENNVKMYNHFKEDYKITEEDLVYFVLSGNTVNIVTNMDGRTVKHVLGLRECTKAQWETREMAINMHKEIDKIEGASIFSSILGPTCTTQGFCKEGKESCGRINNLK